ncbi:MAG TPA: TetR/AcrR family transcriptional regulator [Sphingopyxis sp.]|nr:TetR/AcrR family transcriptional regulator [Sphingopyxis sp.]HMP46260.1 TetR/AcrR family transcriptional regulator [Sphingopyxis sp.]HMQ18029.1 TetR/AcrR family transcriptional regulator [Sphingopyxis sp.]
MRRTQEERRQESESRLLAAAVKLIAEKGANGFTLAEVGHEAGYSRSLPGHYFETKEALLARVVEHITRESLAAITDPDAEPGIASMRARWGRALSADSHRTRALYALFLGAMFDPELAKIMARYNRATVARIADSLREAIARGDVRGDIDVEAEAQALLLFRRGSALIHFTDPDLDLVGILEQYMTQVAERLKP